MANATCATHAGAVLSEDELKRMSRNVKTVVPSTAASEAAINKFTFTVDNVLASAAAPGLNAPHRVAAWNTLCALLDRVRASDVDSVRTLLWDGAVWSRAFDLYLSQGHLARPKSSRQLLATLTAALRNDERARGVRQVQESIARSIIGAFYSRSDHGRAKTCALALGHFLSKDVLPLGMVLEAQSSGDFTLSGAEKTVESLLQVLFSWMGKGDFGSTIAQVVSAVLDRSQPSDGLDDAESGGIDEPLWMSALQKAVQSSAIEMASLRVHLLPALFKRSSADYFAFLLGLGLERFSVGHRDPSAFETAFSETSDDLLYASLQAGKDIGLLCEVEDGDLKQQGGVVSLPVRWIGRLLVRSSRNARLAGLSLLISSPSATKPLLPKALSLIMRDLSHHFADTDANFRSEVFSLFQRLVDRIRAITALLARHTTMSTSARTEHAVEPAKALRSHEAFLEWLTRFLVWELRPTASYQRHISAVKCLSVLVRSGLDAYISVSQLSKSALSETRWPFHMPLMTPALQRGLLNLLVDPFDDVRQTASSILGMYSTQDSSSQEQVRLALSRAEDSMLATGRADQADGVAHLYTLLHAHNSARERKSPSTSPEPDVLTQLVDRLEQMLHIAGADLSRAVDRYPVHGLLTSIRYILGQMSFTAAHNTVPLDRLSVCVHTVWEVVKPILCNDAPEGYLPEGLGEEIPDVTTKDTLSYCWRALKEASLVLGVLVSAKSGLSSVSQEDDRLARLDDLCNLCFTQLAELRHRGAFSTVAQTWITCCTRTAGIAGELGQSKLYAWYDRVLLILRNKTTINTRRSAGLPSLLCGILVAEPSDGLMTRVFSDLETIAREVVDPAFAQEGSLPQVHAMNCMKDILKNSRLGEQSERHVPTALKLAADALRSQAWAVRNCGLMLFRAVIDRLLGTSDAYLEDDAFARKKLSVEQHPELLEIVLGLLAAPASAADELSSVGNEGVFPALQLLQRLSVPEGRALQVQQSVQALTASRVWHVRDKAARTYASLIAYDQFAMELKALLRMPTTRQNALHGALLAAKYIIQRLASTAVGLGAGMASKTDFVRECMILVTDAAQLKDANVCPITRGAYVDLHTECLAAAHPGQSKSFMSSRPGSFHWLLDTHFVWDGLLDEARSDAATAIVLANFATALAAQMAFVDAVTAQQSELIRSVVARLASQDPGACIAFFSHATRLLSMYTVAERMDQIAVIIQACTTVLRDPAVDAQLRSQVVESLLDAADRLQSSSVECQQFHEFARAHTAISQPVSPGSSQRYADLWLQLQAACIEDGARHRETVKSCGAWADACCAAVMGSAFYSAEAAALAIGRIASVWAALAASPEMSEVFLRLCLAVYDLLNDDDEEIRDVASRATCKILATEGQRHSHEDLAPAVASQRLLAFLIRRWSADNAFHHEAFFRAFGISQLDDSDIAERLVDTVTDTALFAEEKQNLYIDDAREVKAWSQTLLLLPAQDFPNVLLKRLGGWTAAGLDTLTDRLATRPDGALGWTTTPEGFVLGLQVVYAVEVLLHCAAQGGRISVRPSRLRRGLAVLSSSGDEGGGMNGLWKREVDRVVADSVTEKLRIIHARLRNLRDRIGLSSLI
ncbi:hypothetical protein LTR36_001804 [Oleoguttula mirabilis]|uniref:DUF2428 domain-containing protein n=1 Tax=Oleoguttula mirabilis TaxID=1507867 RepID=A0AAV9JNB6_9PEZI|nr:hypothetical protein LTR36_001804 [Oleoguttula mirabilis]